MEAVSFNENEQRYFNELFSFLDSDNSGNISGSKALEFLRMSGLPQEEIQKVSVPSTNE